MSIDSKWALFKLPERELLPELMDDPSLEAELHSVALRGLRRINTLSRTAAHFRNAIEILLLGSSQNQVRILELACGGGDVLLELESRLKNRSRQSIELEGCDFNPRAIQFANNLAREKDSRARFFTLDAVNDSLPPDFDILISSLFLHHLEEGEAVGLLRRMAKAAKRGIIVSDLERCRVGILQTYIGVRLLSRSPIVHIDGVRSVRASFTRHELTSLVHEAGLKEFTVERHWPSRLLMVWRKPS